ncbi:hypothetical protein SDC9_103329 [bioreactor metagenome]|uniref:Uncharacterized protein n=1 Tax=bioreactor metagenome TaxID=1076179 RepID=A0A645B039_9ZZZZ
MIGDRVGIESAFDHVGGDDARRHGIDGDGIRAQLASHGTRHGHHGALAGHIGHQVGSAPHGGVGSQIDDGTAPAVLERRTAGTGHQPDAAHIDVHHLIPLFQGDVVHALAAGVRHGRVVDQAIQTAEGLHGLLCALLDGIRVACIKGDAVSLEAHGAQLGNGFAQQLGAQIGHHKLRPLLAQRLRKSKTQAARSAGHKNPAPSELTGGRHGVEGHLKPCLFQI